MLIIKIMSAADLADSDPGKEFKLISDVISVSFTTDDATEYEKTMLGYKSEGRRHFCTIEMPDGKIENWVQQGALGDYFDLGGKIIDDWYQEHPGGDSWPSRREWLSGRHTKSESVKSGLTVSFAKIVVADPLHPNGKREEVHLLTGNCYVLNDRGKTIESFWARRTPTGELVSE